MCNKKLKLATITVLLIAISLCSARPLRSRQIRQGRARHTKKVIGLPEELKNYKYAGRRAGVSDAEHKMQVGGKRRFTSRKYSPERLSRNNYTRRLYDMIVLKNVPKTGPGAYLRRDEKQGLRRLLDSRLKTGIEWASPDLQRHADYTIRYPKIKSLLGRRYADNWLKRRDALRRRIINQRQMFNINKPAPSSKFAQSESMRAIYRRAKVCTHKPGKHSNGPGNMSY